MERGTPVLEDSATPNLVVQGISKSFAGARALDDVTLSVGYGEIHGLLGHNGSGKSTLIKILSGVHAPDSGHVRIGERDLPLPLPPGEFNRFGIAVVHQALGLVPSLSVTENLLVRRLVRDANPMIRWGRAKREAEALFSRYGLSLDPDALVSKLAPVERALLAIIRAFSELDDTAGDGGLLILDEPTPFLSRADVEQLFALVRALADRGTSVIFVSHDVDEVIDLTDRATVLRNGRVAASLTTRNASKSDFISAIVGRSLNMTRPPPRTIGATQAAVVTDLRASGLEPFNLTLRRGEVVGLTGLLGSGYDWVPYLLYGAKPADGGTLSVGGAEVAIADVTPSAAMRLGMVLVPGDRPGAAVADGLSVAENIALPVFGRLLPRLMVTGARINQHAATLAEDFDIRPREPERAVRDLSGGNQQKVVLAKWLQTGPDLILLDEPTQGVDVGARQQVYEFIRKAADRGASILCASSDHEQLEAICDRVLIFSRGRVVSTLSGDEITKHAITERCLNSLGGNLQGEAVNG
nr:sugar ABC transporter ATP-binding protein [Pseudaminobacter soli]